METLELEIDEAHEMERAEELAEEVSAEILNDGGDYDGDDEEFIHEFIISWAADDHGYMAEAYRKASAADRGLIGKIVRYLQAMQPRQDMVVYRGTGASGKTGRKGLESWTASREVAEFYAARNGGQVIERHVTASEILCTWETGFGLESAQEIVIINA